MKFTASVIAMSSTVVTSDDAIAARTVGHIERMGLASKGAATYTRVMRFRYGYPVYDHEHARQTARLRAAVSASGVHLLGRFAEFKYINSDVCVERAMRLGASLSR